MDPVSEEACAPGFAADDVVQPEKFLLVASCYQEVQEAAKVMIRFVSSASRVQWSEIVITYRFSQPSEPAALVLPRAHRLNGRSRAPEERKTIGDHMLRRRFTAGCRTDRRRQVQHRELR